MTNKKISVVQKARYGILVLPVAFLFFSTLAMTNQATPRYGYILVQGVNIPLSASEIASTVGYGWCTLWILVKILRQVKNHVAVSAELKGGFPLFLGLAIWRFSPYIGIICLDFTAIIMIVTLLQGKRFGPFTLYHRDVQIE